jgi:hypothetical protein
MHIILTVVAIWTAASLSLMLVLGAIIRHSRQMKDDRGRLPLGVRSVRPPV